MTTLEEQLLNVTENTFEKTALEIFRFQYENCKVYQEFVKQLNKPFPTKLKEIPFLPISFFKTHTVLTGDYTPTLKFLSSGTTKQNRSTHFVLEPTLYEKSFRKTYENFTGDIENQVILALLPNYLEQGNSSLVYMVDDLIKKTKSSLSGFYKDDELGLIIAYEKAIEENNKVVIFGVSYALLDLAKSNPNLSKATIIETGGMKGRRKEISKTELHSILKAAFNCEFISSEYGMTELFSQAYSDKNELFSLPPWMKILIRETNDPFSYEQDGKTGGINVIDLANLYSCSFISTQDLGQLTTEGKLKLMGRFDNSDIRGCNLMIE